MDKRRQSQQTDLSERQRLVRLWMRGMSCRAIARESGKSTTTVCRWIRRWHKEGNLETRPQTSRNYWFHRRRCAPEPCTVPQSCMNWLNLIHYLKCWCKPETFTDGYAPTCIPYMELKSSFNIHSPYAGLNVSNPFFLENRTNFKPSNNGNLIYPSAQAPFFPSNTKYDGFSGSI